MKRKEYERPTMDVVEVKQQAQLLAGSNGVDPVSPFNPGGDPLNQSAPELDFLNPMDE